MIIGVVVVAVVIAAVALVNTKYQKGAIRLPRGFRPSPDNDPSARVRPLNLKKSIQDKNYELTALKQAYPYPTFPGHLHQTLEQVLKTRRDDMIKLMKVDPAAAVNLVFDPAVKARLPFSLQNLVEEKGVFEGTLEIWHEDDFVNKISKNTLFLRLPNRKEQLHLAKLPRGIKGGARIKVHGISLEGGSIAGDEVTEEAAAPPVPQEVSVVALLLNFNNTPALDPALLPIVEQIYCGEGGEEGSVQDYYRHISYGQVSISCAVYGVINVPRSKPSNVYTEGFLTDVLSAATAYYSEVSSADNIVIIYNDDSSPCGMNTVGAYADLPLGLGYVNPGCFFIPNVTSPLNVATHELGHGFGSLHASRWDCPLPSGVAESLTDPDSPPCVIREYGDDADVMGDILRPFSAFHREVANWLPAEATVTVSSPGPYTLVPLSAREGVRQLVIPLEPNRDYSLEYRQPGPYEEELDGVLIRYIPDVYIRGLQGDSDTLRPQNLVINPGLSFVDPYRNVRVTLLEKTAAQAKVQIDYTPPPILPDLHVRELNLVPLPDGSLKITVPIENRGWAPIPPDQTFQATVELYQLSTDSYTTHSMLTFDAGLLVGATDTKHITIPATLRAGVRAVRVTVDPATAGIGNIAEALEDNNSRVWSLPLYDLVAQSIEFTAQNGGCQMVATIANQGSQAVTDGFGVNFYRRYQPQADFSQSFDRRRLEINSPLEPGATLTIPGPVFTAPQCYQAASFEVWVDDLNDVELELNEYNNVMALTPPFPFPSDLTIRTVTTDLALCLPHVVVENQGLATPAPLTPWQLQATFEWWAPDGRKPVAQYRQVANVTELAPGATVTIKGQPRRPMPANLLKVQISTVAPAIAESNLENNRWEGTFECSTTPPRVRPPVLPASP